MAVINAKSSLKAGRRYSIDGTGITSLRREYVVVLDSAMDLEEMTSFKDVPAIGSVHPNFSDIFASSYDVEEGTGSARNTIKVIVNYTRAEVGEIEPGEGSEDPPIDYQIVEWGWDAGTEDRELLTDAVNKAKAVVNSANDPFESVPRVMAPAPTFTKVMKFSSRMSGWSDCNCKVNSNEITISGRKFPVGSLLCQVAEKRLIGEDRWKFQYTVQLKYKSNPVAMGCGIEDLGWDVAVADAGMREYVQDAEGNFKKRVIRTTDPETGKRCVVSSAALLDGSGKSLPIDRASAAVMLKFAAYERAYFPSWFYDEPVVG